MITITVTGIAVLNGERVWKKFIIKHFDYRFFDHDL